MKQVCPILFLLMSLFSCKKWEYDRVRIHGRVLNGCLGLPMPNQQVALVEVKGEILGPGNGHTLKTVTANINGEYDFAGVQLRKNSNYTYYVSYVHKGNTTSGFCDFYEVDRSAIDQNRNLVIFVGGGISFQLFPGISALGPSDSIQVKVNNTVDFSLFYCNPGAVNDYKYMVADTLGISDFSSLSLAQASASGNAYYYIEITKIKSGVATVEQDTIYVDHAYTYTINW